MASRHIKVYVIGTAFTIAIFSIMPEASAPELACHSRGTVRGI